MSTRTRSTRPTRRRTAPTTVVHLRALPDPVKASCDDDAETALAAPDDAAPELDAATTALLGSERDGLDPDGSDADGSDADGSDAEGSSDSAVVGVVGGDAEVIDMVTTLVGVAFDTVIVSGLDVTEL